MFAMAAFLFVEVELMQFNVASRGGRRVALDVQPSPEGDGRACLAWLWLTRSGPTTSTLPATAWLATARKLRGKNTAVSPTCFYLIGTPQYCSGIAPSYRSRANTLGTKLLECAVAKSQMLDAKTVRKTFSGTNTNFYRPAP